ncbi:MAG: hypothetical protein J0L87_15000, partial [Bacteroidetes bacterium]|nr:hypothetical protein [Bacteroidota bacterium]
LHQDLRPAEVVTDAALLHALLHALLDWCVEHARSRLEFAVDVEPGPAHARLQCRFAHRPADPAAERESAGQPGAGTALDSTAWRLVECLAQALGLLLQRDARDGMVQLTLGFPPTGIANSIKKKGSRKHLLLFLTIL